MSAMYSQSFVSFIKTVLMNSCYAEYCRQVAQIYSKSECYKVNLIEYKNDKMIWDNIFYKYHDLFNYYLHLSTNYKNLLLCQPRIVYEQIHLASTYLQFTFQEYVDEQVNYTQCSAREYMNFAKSMRDEEFKNKMIERYRTDIETRNLKNHLIYIIQLNLAARIEDSKYFTSDEQSLMNLTVDPIPYFEHLNKNTKPLDVCNFTSLEERVFEHINKTL